MPQVDHDLEGPWILLSLPNDLRFIVTDSRTECEIIAGPYRHELPTVKGNSKVLRRARLIAAAPDLLAALEIWAEYAMNNGWTDADHHSGDPTVNGWISMTRAAIAKAKGGTDAETTI